MEEGERSERGKKRKDGSDAVIFLVRDTISESLSDILLKSQTPVEALWSLRSIDLRVIALHPSFVDSRMPQNASLVPLISKPLRVNAVSFVIHKRGNSQYPDQFPQMRESWKRVIKIYQIW